MRLDIKVKYSMIAGSPDDISELDIIEIKCPIKDIKFTSKMEKLQKILTLICSFNCIQQHRVTVFSCADDPD